MNREARSIASKGRYGDDVLLHVNRRELEGIEQIVGRPLTYNPETGLPEAFGWQNIIPIVAGIAGGVVGGPLGAAAASGVASAGVSAAEGDDMQTALTKGLVSGATSYAGGQLLGGVGAAGNLLEGAGAGAASNLIAPAATDAAVQGGMDATAQAAIQGGAAGAGVGGAPVSGVAAPAISSIPADVGAGASVGAEVMGPPNPIGSEAAFRAANGQAYGDLSGDALRQVNAAYTSQPYLDQASDIGRGLTSAEALSGAVRQNPMSAMTYAAGTYGQLTGMMDTPGMPAIQKDTYDRSKYPERFPAPRQANMPGPDYRPGIDPEWRYFAAGGLASLPTRNVPRYDEAQNVVAEARAAMLGEHPARSDAMGRLRDRMGPEAVRAVREEGGRVRGAGGGLDDLVPGTIEGRQRVRLADGEFVVPSDVVSGIGDGSTDQGARKLHEMMNRVRMQKNGTKKQPGRVGRSVMPA